MLIAHATEQLDPSEPSFVHAIGLAAASGAAVRSIHAFQGSSGERVPPHPRALLARWGRSEVEIEQHWLRSRAGSDDVTDALLEVVAMVDPDLLIMSTRAVGGLTRLLAGSVAESVARNVGVPTLLLPHGAFGIVDAETGALRLERALLLAGPWGDGQRAADALCELCRLASVSAATVELLHIRDGSPSPPVALPASFRLERTSLAGPIERAAFERAREFAPDVLVMTSRGHDQLSDVLFASHTERVLHRVARPLLWVPSRWTRDPTRRDRTR